MNRHLILIDVDLIKKYVSEEEYPPEFAVFWRDILGKRLDGAFTQSDWDSLRNGFLGEFDRKNELKLIRLIREKIQVYSPHHKPFLKYILTENHQRFSQRFEDIPDCSLRYLLTIVASDDDLQTWAAVLNPPSDALIHLTIDDRLIPADETLDTITNDKIRNSVDNLAIEDIQTTNFVSISFQDLKELLGLDDEDEQRRRLEKTVIVAVNKGSIALALSVLFQQQTSVVLVRVEESGFSTPLVVLFAPQDLVLPPHPQNLVLPTYQEDEQSVDLDGANHPLEPPTPEPLIFDPPKREPPTPDPPIPDPPIPKGPGVEPRETEIKNSNFQEPEPSAPDPLISKLPIPKLPTFEVITIQPKQFINSKIQGWESEPPTEQPPSHPTRPKPPREQPPTEPPAYPPFHPPLHSPPSPPLPTHPPTYSPSHPSTNPPTSQPSYPPTDLPTKPPVLGPPDFEPPVPKPPPSKSPSDLPNPSPNQPLLNIINFDTDGVGNPLDAGTVIDDEFQSMGITIATHDPIAHPAMIFDSNNPTGEDFDLSAPAGNHSLGNILIISEDGDSSDPDDNANGGVLHVGFGDNLVQVHQVGIMDMDFGEVNGSITTFDLQGNIVENLIIPNSGDRSIQDISLSNQPIDRMEIYFPSSGAVSYMNVTSLLSTERVEVMALE